MPRFCPKCNGLMQPFKESNIVYMKCIRCGFKIQATDSDLKQYGLSIKITHSEKEKLTVISDIDTSNLPITREIVCPKCGFNEAYYWFLQTRAADEPATRFYKCRKCGNVWREYE
ncbi:MAG: transcription factor S [Desulfurococcaceae archaeon]